MDARQESKIKMFNGFDTFLDENESVYLGNKPLEKLRANFKKGLTTVNDFAAKQSTTKTGYSEEKRLAKIEMGTEAAILSGFALVGFKETKNTLAASKLHISITDFTGLNDAEAPAMVLDTYNLLKDNLSTLVDHVSQDDIDNLLALYVKYLETQGSSEEVNASSPIQTAEFAESIKDQDEIIDDIRLTARKFMKSNPTFYKELIANSTPPPVIVHHTTLSISVTHKITKQPIANAAGKLSNSKKTGTTNAKGFMIVEQIRNGRAQLILSAPNCKDLEVEIVIIRGKDNHFDLEME